MHLYAHKNQSLDLQGLNPTYSPRHLAQVFLSN